MIERILEQEKAIGVVLGSDRKVSNLVLSWQDLDVLTAINAALSPLAEFTDVMSGETYVTGSAISPIIDLLTNSFLNENTDDKPLTNELRQAILLDLQTRNNDPNVVDLLEVCSFLDPRFKTKYIQNEEKVKETIYRDGITINDSTCASTSGQSTSHIVPPGKRKRTLGSLFKVHEDEMDLPTISPEQKIKADVLNETRC